LLFSLKKKEEENAFLDVSTTKFESPAIIHVKRRLHKHRVSNLQPNQCVMMLPEANTGIYY
jgi:hypothetical protein